MSFFIGLEGLHIEKVIGGREGVHMDAYIDPLLEGVSSEPEIVDTDWAVTNGDWSSNGDWAFSMA